MVHVAKELHMSYQNVIGVDMSKSRFNFSRFDATSAQKIFGGECANTSSSILMFIRKQCKAGQTHVILEATGTYHLQLCAALAKHQIAYSIVNPLVIRRFAQMKMNRAKNDKVDADIIGRYGYEQKPALTQPVSADQQAIRSQTAVLEGLIKQRTQLSNMLHAQMQIPEVDSIVIQSLRTLLKQVDRQIEKLEQRRQELVEKNYAETTKLIVSINGIGRKTAAAVAAYMGDLGQFETAKQGVAFIGLNPMPESSGTSLNKTRGISKQGNVRLRTLFYLAALSAARYNKPCKELYDRLIQRGKSKKTALIAVANKLVKIMFAVVKNNRTWKDILSIHLI